MCSLDFQNWFVFENISKAGNKLPISFCSNNVQAGPSMMWFFYACCTCSMRSFSNFLPGQPRSDISQNLCPPTQCTHAAACSMRTIFLYLLVYLAEVLYPCCRLQHACTMQLGQPIGTEKQYACFSLQHAYTMQLGKDSEKYNFQASQAENLEKLRMLQVQHAQKNHIIDGPACMSHGQMT